MASRALILLKESAPLLAAFGGLGLLGGLILMVWFPDEMGRFALATLGSGLALIVLAALAALGNLKSALSGRRGRQTANAAATIVLVGAALLLANLAAVKFPQRWDVTATAQFTPANQSLHVLENLAEPVRIIGFYAKEGKSISPLQAAAADRLNQFQRRSKGTIEVAFVDPDAQPSVARRYDIPSFPALVFEGKRSGKRQTIPGSLINEQDLISAILVATGERRKKVYFLTGHRERDILDLKADGPGIGLVARGIAGDNYEVIPLNLHERGGVPEDAATLVLADPRRDLLEDEEEFLGDWLAKGGRAAFLLESDDAPDSILRLLAPWGITVRPGVVTDPVSSVTGDPRTPLIERSQYRGVSEITTGSAIAAPLDVTFFPGATALDRTDAAKARLAAGQKTPETVTPLALTTRESWLIADPARINADPAVDRPGPHALALAVTADGTDGATSLVVFGDADFASNRYSAAFANGDFLINAVNWLCRDYQLMSVRAKPVAYRKLVVTSRELDFIRYSSWFLLPVLVGSLGILAWWRRR